MENDSSRSAQDTPPPASELADQVVDELMPEDLDWRHLVRIYPFPAVVLAMVTGLFLGRHRGHLLLAALSGFVVHRATQNITEALERAGIAIPADGPAASARDRD